jgi:hypothetical protein
MPERAIAPVGTSHDNIGSVKQWLGMSPRRSFCVSAENQDIELFFRSLTHPAYDLSKRRTLLEGFAACQCNP